jgi:HPt (histidine-containing phosphotransfer) domain-containing protein
MRDSLDKYQALVSKRIVDLVPDFLGNRRTELESLRQAVGRSDFDELRHLAHRMRGVGGSYGFDYVTTLGRQIDQFARAGDVHSLVAVLDDYADYLANVRIEYG